MEGIEILLKQFRKEMVPEKEIAGMPGDDDISGFEYSAPLQFPYGRIIL